MYKQHSIADLYLWRRKSLLRDSSPSFRFVCFFLSSQTFTLSKHKTAHVCPFGMKKGHRGQTSWARLLPDTMVELSVTPPHTVSAWSDRADKKAPVILLPLRLAPAPVSTFNSLLIQQAWDAEYEPGWKGEQGWRDDNRWSRRPRKLGDSPADLSSCSFWSETF